MRILKHVVAYAVCIGLVYILFLWLGNLFWDGSTIADALAPVFLFPADLIWPYVGDFAAWLLCIQIDAAILYAAGYIGWLLWRRARKAA